MADHIHVWMVGFLFVWYERVNSRLIKTSTTITSLHPTSLSLSVTVTILWTRYPVLIGRRKRSEGLGM
jgi:hypothetical protein